MPLDRKTTYLFNDPPAAKELARRTDPEESKKAAREIQTKLPKLFDEMFRRVKCFPDYTAMELTYQYHDNDSRRCGRRLSDLASRGLIYKSGSRTCSVTGKTAATWRICGHASLKSS